MEFLQGISQDEPDWASAEAFLNHPEIWPSLSQGVARELWLATSADSLVPIPHLEEYSEAFRPLQVFFEEKDLTGATITKLKKRQNMIFLQGTSSEKYHRTERPRATTVRQWFNVKDWRLPCLKPHKAYTTVNLDEIVTTPNVVSEIVFDQSTSRKRNPFNELNRVYESANERFVNSHVPLGNVQTRRLQFVLSHIYAKQFDVRKLLGCQINLNKRRNLRGRSSIKIVLETFFAKKISCVVTYTTTFPGSARAKEWRREVSVDHCPVVFRYAKLTVDKYGVIDDVKTNHGEQSFLAEHSWLNI
ncbi:uncharacterized protein [Diadema setosum]|uniref:uncharacterized protein n=1 Tax=Diadema setosum TaxID=31175 RepID=UPI003B3A9087